MRMPKEPASEVDKVGDSYGWAVTCTRYECRLTSDPSVIRQFRGLQITYDCREPGSPTNRGVAAITHGHNAPFSGEGQDRAPSTTNAAADQHGDILQTTPSCVLATASLTHPPGAQDVQKKPPQSSSGVNPTDSKSEGMHAVGGEARPCIQPDVDPGRPSAAPATWQLAVLAKTDPGGHPSKACFRRWKGSVWSGKAGGGSAAGEGEAGGGGAVVQRSFACEVKRRTVRGFQAQLRRFTADDVLLGQFVICGQDSRCCGGAILTRHCD